MRELDNNFYCSAGYWKDGDCFGVAKDGRRFQFSSSAHNKDCAGYQCRNYHRKYPTLEQFKEEYGFEWEGSIYYIDGDDSFDNWEMDCLENAIEDERCYIVCACTPFGIPPSDWRPE